MEIQYIDIEDIVENPNNFFTMNDKEIQILADDIRDNGLYECPIVKKIDNGKYMLISGHRRCRAIRKNKARNENTYNMVPCKVVENINETQEMLTLINSNLLHRNLTFEDKIQAVQNLSKIIPQIKAENKEKGRTVEIIAEMLNISPRSTSLYKTIGENISEDAVPFLEDKNISKNEILNIVKNNKKEDQKDLIEKQIEQNKEKKKSSKKIEKKEENKKESIPSTSSNVSPTPETSMEELDDIFDSSSNSNELTEIEQILTKTVNNLNGCLSKLKSIEDLDNIEPSKFDNINNLISQNLDIISNCKNFLLEMFF